MNHGATGLKLRDRRNKQWFWMEREIVDEFVPLIGAFGAMVYMVLCSGTYESEVRMTLREIGEKANVSKDTVSRVLWKMGVLGMIGVKKAARGRCRTPEYELYNLQEAAACGVAAMREKLEAAELERTGQKNPPKEVRLVDEGTGMLLFEESDASLVSATDKGSQAGSPPVQGPVLVAVGDKDSTAEKISKPTPATPRPLRSPVVSHPEETPFNTREEIKNKNNHPNPSASGGACEAEVLACLERATQAGIGGMPEAHLLLGEVMANLGRLKPRLGDVTDLRDQVAAHLRTAGFAVEPKTRVDDRGDGAAGYLELAAVRVRRTRAVSLEPRLQPERWLVDGTERLAIEIDSAVPRERTLMKLRAQAGVHRVVILRTALQVPESSVTAGIDTVLALGWPDNGAAKRAEAARAAVDAAKARTLVGSDPRPRGVPMLGETFSTLTPAAASLRLLLEGVREQVAAYGEGALAEWDAGFGGMAYERHEASGGDGAVLLVVTAPNPLSATLGLRQFGERLARKAAEVFGIPAGKLTVQVQAWEGALEAGAADECQRQGVSA